MPHGRIGLECPIGQGLEGEGARPLTDALIRNVQMLARYNRLANARLYAACAQLSEADL